MKLRIIVPLALIAAGCSADVELTAIPAYPSVTELVAMLEAGETTSEAIVTELLSRADANASLNAFITLDGEAALARARELDAMRSRGEIAGPLHGIPLVAKDNIHVAGMPNTAGTPGLDGFVPPEDAPSVAALREAGAIVLGKTNLHELAFGITSDNAAYGAVGNPFDTSRIAGGSSGGTAAAVSAGMAPIGLGTDTGGSVRIPAALTGIVGFRPSTERYDSSAVTPISHTRDTVGIIGRNAMDVALLDTVLGGGEMISAADPAELRLGIARDYYYSNIDQEIAPVVESALQALADAGVTLVDVDPENIAELDAQSSFPIALYETVEDLGAYLSGYATGLDFDSLASATASPDVNGLFASLSSGEGRIPREVYEAGLVAREEMRRVFRDYFETNDLDAMIFPTTPLAARPIKGSMQTVSLNGEQVPTFPTYIRNTDPASMAALPGISLPVGLTEQGLPVGMEIDGPEGSDRQLLAIAAALEQVFRFSARP